MAKSQAEQVVEGLRAVGWPVVYVENDDGTWGAVAEDWAVSKGWLTRWMSVSKNG
jgi:hypothetical protein